MKPAYDGQGSPVELPRPPPAAEHGAARGHAASNSGHDVGVESDGGLVGGTAVVVGGESVGSWVDGVGVGEGVGEDEPARPFGNGRAGSDRVRLAPLRGARPGAATPQTSVVAS
jgi:hypothetical protein